MELKEIWEQEGKELIKESFPISLRQWGMTDQEILDCMKESFIKGCEFEHNRSHWFDPEKVLPPIDSEVSPLISGHNESIMVLAKTDCDQIEVAYYNFTTNKWSCEDKVISWAYIPK